MGSSALIEDWDQRDSTSLMPTYITPGNVRGMILEHEKASNFDRLTCSRSFREGWKLYFTHTGTLNLSRPGKENGTTVHNSFFSDLNNRTVSEASGRVGLHHWEYIVD